MNPWAWWRRDGVIKRKGVVENMCVNQMDTWKNSWESWSQADDPSVSCLVPWNWFWSFVFSFFAELAWIQGFLRVGITDTVGRVLLTALSIFMKGHNIRMKKSNPGLRFETLPGQWGLAYFIILLTAAVSFPLLSPRSHSFLPQGLCLRFWQCHPQSF